MELGGAAGEAPAGQILRGFPTCAGLSELGDRPADHVACCQRETPLQPCPLLDALPSHLPQPAFYTAGPVKRAAHALFCPVKAAAWALFGAIFKLQTGTPGKCVCCLLPMHAAAPGTVERGVLSVRQSTCCGMAGQRCHPCTAPPRAACWCSPDQAQARPADRHLRHHWHGGLARAVQVGAAASAVCSD